MKVRLSSHCASVAGLVICMAAGFGGSDARGQGVINPTVLNTAPGEVLSSGSALVTFADTVLDPTLQLKFGFATAEAGGPGQLTDAFTLTLQDTGLNLTFVLVTVDAAGPVWAPVTPGTTPLSPAQLAWSPIAYPSLTPVLPQQWAYDLAVALPAEVSGRTFTLYFDLFNNDNALPSQGWFTEVTVVPEPGVWALLGLGALMLWWRNRRAQWLPALAPLPNLNPNLTPTPNLPFTPSPTLNPPLVPELESEIKLRRRTKIMKRGKILVCALGLLLCLLGPGRVHAQDRTFRLNDTDLTLAEVTPEADVYFRSMRLNRALNVWNVEVTVSNKVGRLLSGPVVLLVDAFSGTTGAQQPDGTTTDGKGYFDLSALAGDGALNPGEVTVPRTLTLGRTASGSPSLTTKLFAARPPVAVALGVTRSLDEAGRPLPGVALDITGPVGAAQQTSDAPSGVASFGQGPGEHLLKFSTDGYLPVWRQPKLAADRTTVLPNPRLTKRSSQTFSVTPLGGTTVSNATGTISIDFAAGAVSQSTTMTLTPLTGQNLPAFLPQGWSPLNAFWLESSSPVTGTLNTTLKPAGPINANETAALVKWNDVSLQWLVVQTLAGNGTNTLAVTLPGTGSFALVAGDVGPLAPPAAQLNQPLPASTVALPEATGLTATGDVMPPASPASVIPEFVTGTANLVVTHATTNLPSGYLLRGEVTETYLLSDGSLRLTPQYEHFVVGYQRPGDQDPRTLHAAFPMRPVLLFGSDQLEEATVRVDVLSEQPFDGQVLDAGGGQVGADGVRLLAGSGRLTGPSAIRLRRLDATVFTNLVSAGQEVVAAFDLTVDGSTLTGTLGAQLTGAPTNGLFVVARVLSETGFYGLQPVERLQSDANGNLSSLEPLTGERLPGLRGSGQFVLVQVGAAQGLVSGVARNGQGQVQLNMPVRLTGLPWLTLTDALGRFQLVAPVGEVEVGVTDPLTGDTGFVRVNIPDPQTPVGQDVGTAPAGPRVAQITPGHNATRVPRVGSVVIRFNEAVNPGTVIGNAIQLLKPDNSVVTAALTLNLRNTIATLSPAVELEAGTTYRVRLAATIADPGGLPLEGQSEFSFTTVPLSTRVATAQLIIYEPGATNVPSAILDDIPAFEPGDDPFAIVVHGQPGVADPEVPVILVNESTGETQTVLSKVDGSFSSFISGTEEDFVSATFVNLNGTRVYVPVSRQEFDNGFVGLYPQGGILEAQSDGGPVRVIIESGAIDNRSLFKIDAVPLSEVLARIGNTQPEGGQVLGGVEYKVDGNAPTTAADIEFPVDPSKFNLEPGEAPEDRSFALCRAIEVDGQTVFEILDKMEYENGKLITRSPPFPGLPHLNFLFLPLMMSFGTTSVVVGQVVSVPSDFGEPTEAQIQTADPPIRRVRGAVVSASTGFSQGPLRRGAFVCKANSLGFFSFILPINRLDPSAVLLRAQDPRYPGIYGFRTIVTQGIFDGPFAAQAANIVMRLPSGSAGDGTPPVLTAFPPVAVMPVGNNVPVQFLVRDGASTPTLSSVVFDSTNSVNLVTGEMLSDTNVVITLGAVEDLGPGQIRVPVEFKVKVSALVGVVADVTDSAGNARSVRMRFRFGVAPDPSPGNLQPGDPDDTTPPEVVFVSPAPGSTIRDPIILYRFSEPVDLAITNVASSISLSPLEDLSGQLSPDQREFVVRFTSLVAGETYTITLNSGDVKDLSGNSMSSSHTLQFEGAPTTTATLGELSNSAGSVVLGSYAFTAQRLTTDGELVAHLLGDVQQAAPKGRLHLPFYPRAISLIPRYDFKVTTDGVTRSNVPLVAVSGGVVGAETIGQILWVIDVSDPTNPRRIASEIMDTDPTAAVVGMKWSPPNLLLGVLNPEFSYIVLDNLQAFILGSNRPTNAIQYVPGLDANGDGDFVDEDDQLPVPERNTFFGAELVHPLDDKASLLDFAAEGGGAFLVAVVRHPQLGTTEFQVITFNGQPVVSPDTADGRISYPGFMARRVALDLTFPVETDAGVRFIPVAIIGVENRLELFDLTDPVNPEFLNVVELDPNAGNVFTITRSGTDEYLIGTSNGIFALDRGRMTKPFEDGEISPAVVGVFEGSVFGKEMGATDLEIATAGGGGARMINRAPRLRVVQFPTREVTAAEDLLSLEPEERESHVAAQVELPFLMPIFFDPCDTNAPNPLASPANPALHHYVLVRASGTSGATLQVSLESLNQFGRLNAAPGKDFGPVLVSDEADQLDLDTVQPAGGALTAHRLSEDPLSDLYSTYLAGPFVILRQPLSADQLNTLTGSYSRRYVWGGDNIRAALDVQPNGDPPLSGWLSRIESKEFIPNVHKVYRSLRPEFIDNPNPSFALAAPRFRGVDMQSGEFRHSEPDLLLEGRELDLALTRVYESRGRYAGLFGRGWDFNLNVRLQELSELVLPPGFTLPVGSNATNCLVAVAGDVILYDGAGGVHHFRRISEANDNLDMEAAYATDPAVTEFLGANGANLVANYFESPAGFFTILFKFVDGTFLTVGPTGLRMYFDATGRITKLKGTSRESELEFAYRPNGRLDYVKGDRDVKIEFGYYHTFPSSSFGSFDVSSTEATELGKIARVRYAPSLVNKQEIEYEYDPNGNLHKVKPKYGEETVVTYDADDLNLVVGVGFGDSTELPGQAIAYESGMVKSVTRDGVMTTFTGAEDTAKDRKAAGNSTVSATTGATSFSIKLDDRGRPTEFANRPFAADDAGRPVRVANAEDEVKLIYDENNPVYRFRGNLLRTERTPNGGTGLFVSTTTYDGSAYNRPDVLKDLNGVETDSDYSSGQIVEKIGPITRTLFINDYGQEELEQNTEGITLTRRQRYSIASLSPDGGLNVGSQAFGMNEHTVQRDDLGRIETADGAGASVTTQYNDFGQPDMIFGTGIPTVDFGYTDGMKTSESITASAGSIQYSYSYDTPKHPTSIKTFTTLETGLPSVSTVYNYDDEGRLEDFTTAGETTELGYDGTLVTSMRGPGVSREAEYDAGLLKSLTEQGVEMTFDYDSAGRLEVQTVQGLSTTFTYDDAGSNLRTRLKSKKVEGTVAGTVLDESYTYDNAGRVRTVTSLGQTRTIDYFADGAIRRIDVDGFTAKDVDRDQAGRLLRSRVGGVEYGFSGHDNDFGLPAQETMKLLASGRTLTKQLGYDLRGRLDQITLPSGTLSFTYDGFGHRETVTDPDGVVRETKSHPGGLLQSIKFSDGDLVSYSYNGQQRVDQITSAAGSLGHQYDNEGLVKELTYPDGAASKFEQRNDYFEADQVTHGNVVQTHTWNDGRLEEISVVSTGDTLAYGRDELGRLQSADLNGVAVELTYNERGQVETETTDAGTWEASFDNLNRLVSETYPSGLIVNFTPDQYGLPLTALAAGMNTVSFLGAGFPETFNYVGGLTVTRSYDPSLRLEKITYSPVTGAINNTAGFEYDLTPGGRVRWEKRLHDGTFDVFARSVPSAGMRVTNFLFGAGQQSGNGAPFALTNISFVNGELRAPAQGSPAEPRGFLPAMTQVGQRVTAVDGTTVQYDAFGSISRVPLWVRLPSQSALTPVTATLEYDGLGMLRKVIRADGVEVEYLRDGMGRIAERIVTGDLGLCRPGHRQYAWKGNLLIEELEDTGTGFELLRRYLYLGNTLAMVQAAATPGGTLENRVPLVSLNGSIRGYLRPDGQLLERIEYSAYGEPVFLDASGDAARPASVVAGTLLFHGSFFDEDTGLYQMGQRNLHPLLGRFLQRDSLLFSQSLALFTAFNGDPIGQIDPFGTETDLVGNIAGGFAKAAETKKKAQDLGESYLSFARTLGYFDKSDPSQPFELAGKGLDLISKVDDLAEVSPQLEIGKQAGQYKALADVFKTGMGVFNTAKKIQKGRSELAAFTAQTMDVVGGNIPLIGKMQQQGAASADILGELDDRFSRDRRRVFQTKSEFDSREAYGDLKKKQEAYSDAREENLLKIGKGVNTIAKTVFNWAYGGDESHEVKIANKIFDVNDKIFDFAEKYRAAKGADDLQMMFLTQKSHGGLFLSSEGRSAVSAAFSLGFEAGKLGIMIFADPAVASAYEEQVKLFEENGGWLTVAGGVLSTVGADDAAYLIQQYSDFKATDLIQPILDERARNMRRTEYYLNGLSAP